MDAEEIDIFGKKHERLEKTVTDVIGKDTST